MQTRVPMQSCAGFHARPPTRTQRARPRPWRRILSKCVQAQERRVGGERPRVAVGVAEDERLDAVRPRVRKHLHQQAAERGAKQVHLATSAWRAGRGQAGATDPRAAACQTASYRLDAELLQEQDEAVAKAFVRLVRRDVHLSAVMCAYAHADVSARRAAFGRARIALGRRALRRMGAHPRSAPQSAESPGC